MLRTTAAIIAIAASLAGLSLAAEAQRPDAPAPIEAAAVAISRDHAVEIAERQGMAQLRDVSLSAGAWRVRGAASNGRAILVDVSAQTGAVHVLEVDAR